MTAWIMFAFIHATDIRRDYSGRYSKVTLNDRIAPGDLVFLTLGGSMYGWGYVINNPQRYLESDPSKEMMRLTIPGRVMRDGLVSYAELTKMPELSDVFIQVDNESLIELTVEEANFLSSLFRSRGEEAPDNLSEGGKFGVKDASSLPMRLRLAIKKHDLASVLFIDLDNFKKVNGTYGHSQGDEVIREALGVVKRISQGHGELFHRSGDEMIVLFPNLNEIDSRKAAEEIRSNIEQYEFSVVGKGLITATIGFCTYPDTCGQWEELIDTANLAAMRAKDQQHKNAVVSCSGG